MPARAATVTYVDLLMQEWRMGEQSRRIQTYVRGILNELVDEAHLVLKDPRLEVVVVPESAFSVWAYFPFNRKRHIARQLPLPPNPQTRVLLVLSTAGFEEKPVRLLEDCLRDHLGHTLLYLRDPKARNGCADAQKEWQMSTRPVQARWREKPKGGLKSHAVFT